MGIFRNTDEAAAESREMRSFSYSIGLHGLLGVDRERKIYSLVLTLYLFFSYSVFLIFGVDDVSKLGKEDGIFENLTALFFLVSSIFFLKIYFSRRNGWFLLLALVFFMGFGEEISWGQRMLNLSTPHFLKSINAQKEINIHNIIIFNSADNHGIHKIHTINFIYKSFWLIYGVLLPIAALRVRPISSITERFKLPVPPIHIGIFFLVNWAIFRMTLSFILPAGKPPQYYYAIGEIMECGSAFIFMVMSIYFHSKSKLKSY